MSLFKTNAKRYTPYPKRYQKGFTLIEFLLYMSLVTLGLSAAAGIALNAILGKAKLLAIEETSQNARFVIEKIADDIRDAEDVISPTIGTSASALSLQVSDPAKNPTIFDLSGGNVRIKEGAAAAVDLNSTGTEISSLQFLNVSYPATPDTIRITLTVKKRNPDNLSEYGFEQNFYTTANVRERP